MQRDAAGLIVFDDEVRNYVPPSTRQGQLVPPAARHREGRSRRAHRFRQAVRRIFRISCAGAASWWCISDFYEQPETIIRTVEPLRFHGNEVILFHVLDPQEIEPKLREPGAADGHGDASERMEVTPEYARTNIATRSTRISRSCATARAAPEWTISCSDTGRPLDEALREYLAIRQGRL